MENTNWTLEKNDRTPLKLYEDFKKSERRKEQSWKILSLISSGGFVLSLFVMFFAITRPKTIPLVISVNDIGEARYIGDVSNYSYSGIKIPREAYENQFRRFVKNMFEVPADFQVLKNNLILLTFELTIFNGKYLEDKLKCRIFVMRLGMCKKKGATPFLLSVSLQTTKTI